MPVNPYEAILAGRPRLQAALDENYDISTFFQAVFIQIARVAAEEQRDPRKVRLKPFIDGSEIHVAISWPPGNWKSELKLFEALANQIAQFLALNPESASFAETTVTILKSYAEDHHIPYNDLKIKDAKLARGGQLIFGTLTSGLAMSLMDLS